MLRRNQPGLVFGMIQKQRGGVTDELAGEPGLKIDDLPTRLVARQDRLSDALNLDDSILVLLHEASVRLRGTSGCVASSPCGC